LELAMCMDIVNNMANLWEMADSEDKQGMARNLFEYLVYDLDTRRITDFRLKPWADRFLVLRARLYDEAAQGDGSEGVSGEIVGEKETPHTPEGVHTEMPHSSAVESQAPKSANWTGKCRMRNRICSRRKRIGVDLKRRLYRPEARAQLVR